MLPLLLAALAGAAGAGDEGPVLRGCSQPVEQVKLALPAGDVLQSGSMQLAFVGGSDAVRVRWWRKGVDGQPSEVSPKRIQPYHGFESQSGQRLFNIAIMTGLIPGRYSYEIVDDPQREDGRFLQQVWCGAPRTSYVAEFTFGRKGDGLRIAVMGDMGANSGGPHGGCFSVDYCKGAASVKDVLSASSGALDAVFNIGDIAYAQSVDAVWDDYCREIEGVSSGLPWMTAVGNHEWGPDSGCECGTPYAFRFPMPTNGGAGVDFAAHLKPICHTSVHGRNDMKCPFADDARAFTWRDMAYFVDVGDVRIVVVSTQHGILPGSGQFQWLRETLTTNPKRWHVVMGHIDVCWPCDPLSRDAGDSEPCHCMERGGPIGEYGAVSMSVVQRLLSQERLPVDLVLAGHTHEYYLRNCTRVPGELTCLSGDQAPLVIVGGAGYGDETAPGDAGKERGRQCSHAPYGYVELSFGEDAIEISFRAVQDTGDASFGDLSCNALPEDPDAPRNSVACPALPLPAQSNDEKCSPTNFFVRKNRPPSVPPPDAASPNASPPSSRPTFLANSERFV